jgi:parallel beta-helix repeat protein
MKTSKKKTGTIAILSLLLVSMTLISSMPTVHANETIYIRADGSVDPSTAPIVSIDNFIYTLTDDIFGGIVVQRSNIIINGNGHRLNGTGTAPWEGFYLSDVNNITIQNTNIEYFDYGVYIAYSSNNTVTGNNITNNYHGIAFGYTSGNTIIGNNIAAQRGYGITLHESSGTIITGNNVTANKGPGIRLSYSSGNSITGNNIAKNKGGIWLEIAVSNNIVFHNDFVENNPQVSVYALANVWDDGYPSGGNYWSDYAAMYPNAAEIDNSGLWNTPYVIDVNNKDNYPLKSSSAFRARADNKVQISEIYYASDGNDLDRQYVELYLWENITSDLSGWYLTTFDGDIGVLPAITGLHEFEYIVVHMGNGTDDLDASDGKATVYLNRTEPMLDNAGDEVGLYDSSGTLIDFVRYGGGNGDPVLGNWPSDDPGITANYLNESIQIFGEDMNNSTNWISSPLSEGEANIYDFRVGEIKIRIHDGIGFDNETCTDLIGKVVVEGPTINPDRRKKIEHYVDKILEFYKNQGFNEPRPDADGILHIEVAQGPYDDAGGQTFGELGIIRVGLGTSDIDDKYVIAHELMHAIQWHKSWDAKGDFINRPIESQKFFSEGMAVYWAIAVVNMEILSGEFDPLPRTLNIQDVFQSVGDHNVYENFKDTNRDIFSTWSNIFDLYIGSYLFIKFIEETYGVDKTREIQNRIRNYGDPRMQESGDKLPLDVITEVLGKSLARLIAEWGLWLFNAPSGIPPRNSTDTPFSGPGINVQGTLGSNGIKIENITVNTDKPFTISLRAGDPLTHFSVTVVKIKKNGQKEILAPIVDVAHAEIEISNPTEYEKIILIKSRVDGTGTGQYTFDVFIPIQGDIDKDGKVGLSDLVILAQAYGSKPGDSNWNPNADLDNNGVIGLSDLVILAQNYGKHNP